MAVPSLAQARDPHVAPRPTPLARIAGLVTAYGPAAIIVTLPLEFTTRYTLQPVTRWVMVVVALAAAYEVVTHRRTVTWPRTASAALLVAFVAFAVVSWAIARPPGSLKQLGDTIVYPFVGLLIMNLVVTGDDHRRAWTAMLVSGLGVALVGLVLYLTHTTIWTPNPAVANRLNITFADPNITARFLTLVAAAAIMLFALRQAPAWLCAATAFACAVVQPMTFSRSGLALFVVVALVAAAVVADRRRALAFAACVLVVFALSTVVNPDTRQRAMDAESTLAGLVGVSPQHGSQTGAAGGGDTFALQDNRRYLIAAGLQMFADHPVVGVGFGAYQHSLVSTYKRFIPANVPNPDTVSHTAFVTVAAELGVAGLVLLFAFLLALARDAYLARQTVWALIPATLIVPIVLYSQFEGRLIEEPYLWVLLGLFYAGVRGRPRVSSHTM